MSSLCWISADKTTGNCMYTCKQRTARDKIQTDQLQVFGLFDISFFTLSGSFLPLRRTSEASFKNNSQQMTTCARQAARVSACSRNGSVLQLNESTRFGGFVDKVRTSLQVQREGDWPAEDCHLLLAFDDNIDCWIHFHSWHKLRR